MPYVVTAEGLRAYYEHAGKGPALVMVHGASQDSLSWKYVIDLFAQHYSVYVLDLPGHGKSSLPAGGPYDATPDNARYVLQFLAVMQIRDAVLMGHSMGGGVVAQAAALSPDQVRGLVLVDGASVNVVKSSGYNPDILNMARINPGDWFEVSFRTLMGSAVSDERVEDIIADARRCNPAVAFADICAFGGFRMEHILQDIRCPVVIVEGLEDWSVPPESAREVARRLSEAQIVVEYIEWQNVGHFPQSECPEPFYQDTRAAMMRLSL
ncbi:alpha/beta fold hydrolase [Bordetella avium]|uniref:Probable hydrolase n=1 Tax=Bordetella avium (strain 197N) TaxID=360910 RepID=Q2KVG3_BORA1|nr:alpha/beta hydrolase [Bordetella avium]AZY48483.1 alpha/beta hydrolase [Bordetella avium]AZY51862.1 alpha/beta hydrolase [Bordetella avium]RIQ17137.1 alpha/beta hydrolase [Bordetella avium]RIQ36137.1 alpha/beta hydrolase [Bordetella avium]RIQ54831.1 alpha/beta hydrolase [Bordetella avium]